MSHPQLFQQHVNARSAAVLHTKVLDSLGGRLKAVDLMTICLPILFLGAQYIPEGTFRSAAAGLGDGVSVILLAMVVATLALGWREKQLAHRELLGHNIELAERLRRANERSTLSEEARDLLLEDAAKLETQDRALLGQIAEPDRQAAYLQVLRELGADVVCPVCQRNPWRFSPGDKRRRACDACGNAESEAAPQGVSS